MPDELSYKRLKQLAESHDLTKLTYTELLRSMRQDEKISQFKPSPVCQIDPRDSLRVVYSKSRLRRPHDTIPENSGAPPCPVCTGKTVGVVDITPLSEGYTFINKNLYPILYPHQEVSAGHHVVGAGGESSGHPAFGIHFLQWPSTHHERDYRNMPIPDIVVGLERLAAFESWCLHAEDSGLPVTDEREDGNHFGYVGIIKNQGYLVGGSLEHGHLQMVHTNIRPKRIIDDMEFARRTSSSFACHMLDNNPPELTIRQYDEGVRLLVPYFMKRSLDALIVPEDAGASYLHELDEQGLSGLARALKDATGVVHRVMPEMGLELAYNLVFHTGPIGGMYIELLAYTQQVGGYEHLGIYICQGSPELTTNAYRKALAEN